MAVPGTPVDDLEDCSDIEQSLDKTLASVLLIAKAKVKPTKKIVLDDKDRQRQLTLNGNVGDGEWQRLKQKCFAPMKHDSKSC